MMIKIELRWLTTKLSLNAVFPEIIDLTTWDREPGQLKR